MPHRETPADDHARTTRILQSVETAYATRTGNPCGDAPLTDFEHTILTAATPTADTPYPPPGHDYPRR
ncbi:hypothetical protein IHE56_00920 [Streptomyces sp. ID01-12c]|nr:hypothetical protein [Streptomyces caniscabiei]